jgi:hypothetical protein
MLLGLYHYLLLMELSRAVYLFTTQYSALEAFFFGRLHMRSQASCIIAHDCHCSDSPQFLQWYKVRLATRIWEYWDYSQILRTACTVRNLKFSL